MMSIILAVFEVVLISSLSDTSAEVVALSMSAMSIETPASGRRLFTLCRSPSLGVARCACVLSQMCLLKSRADMVSMLQLHALCDGSLLWHLYLSIRSHRSLMRASSKLVALLVHDNATSSSVICHSLPPRAHLAS